MKNAIVLALFVASAVGGSLKLYADEPASVIPTVQAAEVAVSSNQQTSEYSSQSPDRQELLKTAYTIAKADGHKNPEIVQAVLLQETDGGAHPKMRVSNPGPNAYFGPMQLKLAAAKEVLARFPELFAKYYFQTRTDEEIKANLILNDVFNVEVGSKYLLILQKQYGFTGVMLLNAYNRGPGGAKAVDATYHYGVSAQKKLRQYKVAVSRGEL